ncbi:MAG: flagellar biosynthetic protein FliO [Treponema sp.]|nr:flagellar biosynthetic protein FliO [Treponema sp.]
MNAQETGSQTDSVLNSATEVQQNDASSTTDESLMPITDESTLPIQGEGGSSGSGLWVFVRMILVLGLVLGLIYLLYRFLKKNSYIAGDDDKFLRRAASISLGPGKSVQIVTLIDKAYLVGVSENSINLISEIDDAELINALNLYADKTQSASKPKNFSEILDLFMPGSSKGGAEKNAFEDGKSERILNSLKHRTRTLGEGE